MDECVLRVRAPDGGARGWRSTLFGIAIGLGVGIAGKRMLEPSGAAVIAVAPGAAVAAARVRRDLQGRKQVPPTAAVAICVGGWLELSIPRYAAHLLATEAPLHCESLARAPLRRRIYKNIYRALKRDT